MRLAFQSKQLALDPGGTRSWSAMPSGCWASRSA